MASQTWHDPVAYSYLEDLDEAGQCWECLRRNDAYAADYAQARRRRSPSAPLPQWGLRFAADPTLSSLEHPVFWLPGLMPTVTLAKAPDLREAALTLADLPVRFRRAAADGVHLILQTGLQVHLPEPAGDADPLVALLPQGDKRRSVAVHGLGAVTGELIEGKGPTPLQRRRFLLALWTYDAVQAGATYREIAEHLYGADRVKGEPWHNSPRKAYIARLAQGGRRLVRTRLRLLLDQNR